MHPRRPRMCSPMDQACLPCILVILIDSVDFVLSFDSFTRGYYPCDQSNLRGCPRIITEQNTYIDIRYIDTVANP